MRRHGIRPLLFLIFSLAAPSTEAAPALSSQKIKGRIYAGGEYSPEDKPTHLFQKSVTVKGTRRNVTTLFTSLAGEELAREEFEYENGKLIRSVYIQRQTRENGSMEIRDKQMFFDFHSKGKTHRDSMDLEAPLLTSDNIQERIQENWKALEAGESTKARLVLIELQDTVGFKFFKDGERKFKGKDAVVIRMKPSSIFIAAVVSPLTFLVEKGGEHRLLYSFGRLPIRRPLVAVPATADDWRAIDAALELDYGN